MSSYRQAYQSQNGAVQGTILPSAINTRTVVLATVGTDEQVILAANPDRISATVISADAKTGTMYQSTDVIGNGITVNASGGGTAAVTTSGEWVIVPSAAAGSVIIVETLV